MELNDVWGNVELAHTITTRLAYPILGEPIPTQEEMLYAILKNQMTLLRAVMKLHKELENK